ncbi:MAG: aminotransferase class V-fold PLP-dependent enzyme [Deinococcus sp.]|nr:aminotransferase class V-fold PLP-dependent enzyme [Deinococcus sp.]
MAIDVSYYRSLFPSLEGRTYLNSCSLGMLPQRARERAAQYFDLWMDLGAAAWPQWLAQGERLKALVAELIGAKPHEIALHPNASAAMYSMVSCLDFTQRPKVVYSDLNFPTTAYQWLSQRHRGAQVHLVHSPDGITVPPELVIKAIDERTLILPISHVIYSSAYILDVAAITQAAHRQGALVLLDSYHGVGVVPTDVKALDVDFLVGGMLKWLCGGSGLAFLYVHERWHSQLHPTSLGWFAHRDPFAFDVENLTLASDARQYQGGTPSAVSFYIAEPGLEIIREIGVPAIRERAKYLTSLLIDLADQAGLEVRSPRNPEIRGSTVRLRVPDSQALTSQLLEEKIVVDARGDAVRVSAHFYNTEEEIEGFFASKAIRQLDRPLTDAPPARHR